MGNPTNTPDSHLQNPIRCENRKLFKLTSNQQNRRVVPQHIFDLGTNLKLDINTLDIDSEKLYGTIFSDIYNNEYKINKYVQEVLPNVWDMVQKYIKVHNPFPDVTLSCSNIPLTQEILRLYSIKQDWEYIRLTMQNLRLNSSLKWVKSPVTPQSLQSRVLISQQYIIVKEDNGVDNWLLDYDQVMMITDTIIARVFTLIYVTGLSEKDPSRINPDIIKNIYKFWDDELSNKGNDSYDIIKTWESLIQGIILKCHDPLSVSDDFLDQIVKECEGQDSSISVMKVLDYLIEQDLTIDQLSNIHGIYRHWGHPTVDEEGGCKKVQDIALKRPIPDMKMMRRAKGMFSRQFCISFIQKHSRWPRIKLDSLNLKRPLYKAIKDNITTINFYSPKFLMRDWEKLTFDKEFHFDYHVDFIDVCDDKAISPYLQDLPTIYAKEVLGYDPGKPLSSRRVLLELLRKDKLDIEEICQIIQRREVPENWKIILLHAKERELKIKPRLFAMFVLEMRIYYCVTESNIANTIFPYFPQQTMTLSEVELTKRLYSLSEDDESNVHLPIYMSIDFKSWNIHWSYWNTYYCFKQIDDLFGLDGLYTYSHIFFSECIIAISSRFNPPESLKGNKRFPIRFILLLICTLLWMLHRGGLEGIRQKGWTLITILLLLILEYILGIKSYIIGQGDNQFLKILIPIVKMIYNMNREEFIKQNQKFIRDQLKLFGETLKKVSKGFSLEIKLEESWFSSCVINYGKDILFKGAYMSQGIKRVSRMMADINDLYPTMSTKISSVQTTGFATAQKSYDMWLPMFLCHIETLMLIKREVLTPLIYGIKYDKQVKNWVKTDAFSMFILHGDTNCLSVPILNMHNYLYRGHPDPLSAYLSLLTKNQHRCVWCSKVLYWLRKCMFKLGRGDPELLISDPLSLNIESAPQISQIFKKEIFKKVKSIVKNKNLKAVFNINSEREDESIYKYLISTEPLFPRVLHEIMRQTVTGTRMSVIAKFSSARTIQQMLTQSELNRFFKKIIKSEEGLILYWMKTTNILVNLPRISIIRICPTKLAAHLRNYTWRETVNRKEISGVTIPFPLHQFELSLTTGLDHKNCAGQQEYIFYNVLEPVGAHMINTRGSNQSYHGHRTREKQTGKIFQIPNISRPLRATERLIQLFQWCVVNDGKMGDFMTKLIQTRTDVPMDILKLTTGSIPSGSQVHRLNDHFTKRGVHLNMRPNISTHIYFSSDNMGKYSKGSDNMNMHFQGAIMTGIMYIHNLILYTNQEMNKSMTIHQHYNCMDCEEYIPDIKIDSIELPPKMSSYIDNPLIYCSIPGIYASSGPNTLSFQMVKGGTPSQALASIIFSRILINMNRTTWGLTQKNKHTTSKVSVKDLVDIGVEPVLRHVALLLYLYYDMDMSYISKILCMFSREIWQDFGQVCLIQENLVALHHLSGNSYQTNMFESTTGVSRLLNKALSRQLMSLEESKYGLPLRLVFYIIPGCGITRLYRMWSNFLYISSKREVDVRDICKNLNFDINSNLNIPSKIALDTLEKTIQNFSVIRHQNFIWKIHPFRLSELPAEIVMRIWHIPKKETRSVEKVSLSSLKPMRFLNTSFNQFVEMPINDRSTHKILLSKYEEDVVHVERSYLDHVYHQVHNLSSSFIKILQILLSLNIVLDNPCITLADGEGSISKLLYIMSGKPVYYNSMFNSKSLVPQRAINAVPGEFISCPNGVKLAELSAIYGGNILDDSFFDVFKNSLPGKSSLVTSDAESNRSFSEIEQVMLLRRSLQVCYITRSEWCIHKFFITSVHTASLLFGIANTVYENLFLIVPIYSSNESYECYMVCNGFDPKVTLSEIGTLSTNLDVSTLNLMSKIKTERVTFAPLQSSTSLWKNLLTEAEKLGFQNSLINHVERITEYTFLYDPQLGIQSWLRTTKNKMEKLIFLEWSGISKVTKGISLNQAERCIVSVSCNYHTVLDSLLKWSIYLTVLENMLEYDTIKRAKIRIYELSHLSYFLQDKDSNVLYSYSISRDKIKPDVIRSLWIIWGHIKNPFSLN